MIRSASLLILAPLLLFGTTSAALWTPPGMVLIPAGTFIMGSDRIDAEGAGGEQGTNKPWYLDEHPRQIVSLASFFIDRTEVTNQEYERFIRDTRRRTPAHWPGGKIPPGTERHPVVNVNWYEASAYCAWAGKQLPTEAQWEKAARGSEGREFPWGDIFIPQRANSGPAGKGRPLPVGTISEDESVYGVRDLAGNVMEWTADWYRAYPGSDYSSPDFGEKFKAVRGDSYGDGGHYYLPLFVRSAYRQNVPPEERFGFVGFRCAR